MGSPEDIAADNADCIAHYKRLGFTEAIIRACKHRCSGRGVCFQWLAVAYVRAFSALDPERTKLTEVIRLGILGSEAARSKVIVDLGHTVVADLRERGLWTEQ